MITTPELRERLDILKQNKSFGDKIRSLLAGKDAMVKGQLPTMSLIKQDMDAHVQTMPTKREEIVNQILVSGFIVEVIVLRSMEGYFFVKLHKILAICLEDAE
jgi:hypothetical protein